MRKLKQKANKETVGSGSTDLRAMCVFLAVLAVFSLVAGCMAPVDETECTITSPTDYPVCILTPPPTESTTAPAGPFASPDCEVGDIVTFGKYYTDIHHNTSPLEWRVLDIDRSEGRALLITEQVIDARDFDCSPGNAAWEQSDLRKWLNTDFYCKVFSADDREFIMLSDICTTDCSGKQCYTDDYVFCLSETEANNYLSDSSRQASPTPYAVYNGADEGKTTGNCCWWLRSSGREEYADCVDFWGAIVAGGTPVNFYRIGVRPAIYVYI